MSDSMAEDLLGGRREVRTSEPTAALQLQIRYAHQLNHAPAPLSIVRALELMLLRLEAHEREIRNINAGWDGW